MADINNPNEDILIPKSPRTWGDTFTSIAYWTFPVTALWGLTKLVANRLAGEKIMKLVFPALNTQTEKSRAAIIYNHTRAGFEAKMQQLGYRNSPVTANEFVVRTHDNARLTTVEVNPKGIEPAEKDKTYIIKFCGNNGYYENDNVFQELQDDALTYRATTIGFNFRHVGKSQGTARSTDDLATDAIAQIERLRIKGANPNTIFLKGHSFGAAVAAIVTEHFHQKGYPIRIDSSRSFSKLSEVTLGWLRTGGSISQPGPTGHKETWGGKIKAFFAAPFVRFMLAVTKCELNPAAAFKNIPATHRDYYCVRSSKMDREVPTCLDDVIIPHSASLHAALKSERRDVKKKLKDIETQLKTAGSSDGIVANMLAPLSHIAEDVKSQLRQHKMTIVPEIQLPQGLYPDLAEHKGVPIAQDGHNQPTQKLNNRYDYKNADEHFGLFIERSMRNAAEAKEQLQEHRQYVR
jgi:hypothetical protein